MALSGLWLPDSAGDKGIGPADPATGNGKAFRARNISGDFADIGVVLYDAASNPLLVTANPAYVKTNDGDVAEIGATAAAIVAAGAAGSVNAKLRRLTQGVEDLKTLIVLAAGTALIGKVGLDQTTPGTTNNVVAGADAKITATPTVSTSPAYTSGDSLGGKITLASAVRVSGGGGIVQTLRILDLGKQNAAIDVVFFDSDPSGTTFTDNSALDVADADGPKIIGHVSVLATDYSSFNDNSVATKTGLGFEFKLASGTSLYACLVVRGTPTYTSTSDIELRVEIMQTA